MSKSKLEDISVNMKVVLSEDMNFSAYLYFLLVVWFRSYMINVMAIGACVDVSVSCLDFLC